MLVRAQVEPLLKIRSILAHEPFPLDVCFTVCLLLVGCSFSI